MPNYIKYIQAEGVLGRFDIYQEFQPGVNVIFGSNGTGKTTLLHILANLLNGDFKRFAFIDFKKIQVELDDNTTLSILNEKLDKDSYITVLIDNEPVIENFSVTEIWQQEKMKEEKQAKRLVTVGSLSERGRKIQRDNEDIKPIIPSAYFPAFRTMIEAWASAWASENAIRYPRAKEVQNVTTNFARELFGSFVPNLNYPSLIDIERELRDEISFAILNSIRAESEYLGEIVPNIFQVISNLELPSLGVNSIYNFQADEDNINLQEEGIEKILEEINLLDQKLEEPLRASSLITKLRQSTSSFQVHEQSRKLAQSLLDIYRQALRKVVAVQEESFKYIKTYLNSVNSFLEDKSIETSQRRFKFESDKSPLYIRFKTGNQEPISGIRRVLSSGERQILTLIYAATQMSEQQIVLIDEPEISLHVDWQRNLLKKMSEQLGERQIIVCTHSPVIGADYEDQVIIFEPKISHTSETNNISEVLAEDSEDSEVF